MKITKISFEKILNKNFLFEKHPKIAVAVSGGPDSMAMTFLLNEWVLKRNGSLIAIIIDHGIRKESHFESRRIKDYLTENNIRSELFRVRKQRIEKKNMKEARDNRFDKFSKFCLINKIFHLFVAHHLDDNLETFLLRKISGSNFEGLRSMQQDIKYKNIQILRPLLSYSKIEIITYLNENKIYYENDPSNKNIKYSRVVVRNFLKNNSLYKQRIEKDFDEIIKFYPFYKKMIFQIFNNLHISSSKNTIFINSIFLFKIDKDIQSKIVEIIYKFLKPKNFFLRNSKINVFLSLLKEKNTKKLNIRGMIVKKDLNAISFNNEFTYL